MKDKAKKAAYDKRRYMAHQEFIKEYKLNKGCMDCGYREHHAGLQYDHVRGIKKYNVSMMPGKSMKSILEEIDKCDVVCGTCHAIRTWERQQ